MIFCTETRCENSSNLRDTFLGEINIIKIAKKRILRLCLTDFVYRESVLGEIM
jgi:hypothetical protein